MEPISTALAGFALVKESVDFIKGNIETIKDVGEIFGYVDKVLDGEQQIQKQRFSDKSLLGQSKSAAETVIEAKLAQESLDELKVLVENRFGYGTWDEILKLRKQRLDEEKAEIARIKKQKQKRKEEFQKVGMILASGTGGIIVIIVAGFLIIYLTGGL